MPSRARLIALALAPLALGGLLAPAAIPVAHAASVTSMESVRVNTSEAPRYAQAIALTSAGGAVFAASAGVDLAGLQLWYSAPGTQYSFADYPWGPALSSAVGRGVYVADAGGTPQAIWLDYSRTTGDMLLRKATLGPTAAVATILDAGSGSWPDADFLGATANTLWWVQCAGTPCTLATSPVSDPSNLTTGVTALGDSVEAAQFTGARAVVQYSWSTLPINGKKTRLAAFPDSPAATYPNDGNVVGTAPDAEAVNGLQITQDGVTWMTASYTPGVPNSLSLYQFASGKVSSLATNIDPFTVYTSYLSDPSGGTGSLLVQESGNFGQFGRGDGPIKAISLSTGGTTTLAQRAYGAMPAVSGQVAYYDLGNLESPAIVRRPAGGAASPAGAVERRARTIDAVALSGRTLAVSEQKAEDGRSQVYLYSLNPGQSATGRAVAGVDADVPSTVRERGEALLASPQGIYALGSAAVGGKERVTGFVAIDPAGAPLWANSTDGQRTALRAVTSERLLTRSINDLTNTLHQFSPLTGASLGDTKDVIAEGASGPNVFTAASNSLGPITRSNTLLKASAETVQLDSGCTPLVQAAAGRYVLYDCAGTTKVARIDPGGTATSVELPSGYTWRLGDGFLGYRSGVPGIDLSFQFGWVDLADLANLTLQPLGTVTAPSLEAPAPVFAVDASGGQQMAWVQGMTIAVAHFDVPAAGVLQAQSVSAPAALSAAGGAWAISARYSAPASWRLTVTDALGRERYASSGASPDGNVSASWDGRSGGAPLPDGNYAWRLSAAQEYGSMVSVSTGSVALGKKGGTDAAVKAPASVFGSSFAVSWAAKRPVGVASWQVSYRIVSVDDAGNPTYSDWVIVAESTAKSTAVIGSDGRPVPRGQSVQVRVIPLDAKGQQVAASNTTRTVPVGLDDANLSFGTGWTPSTAPTAYYGTLSSAARKSTATATVYGKSATIFGVKGPTSGSFEVWMDGKKMATVSAYAKKTAGKARLWASPAMKPGAHALEIRALATAKHPKVILDAVLVTC